MPLTYAMSIILLKDNKYKYKERKPQFIDSYLMNKWKKIILKSQINIKYRVNKGDRNTLQKMLSLDRARRVHS